MAQVSPLALAESCGVPKLGHWPWPGFLCSALARACGCTGLVIVRADSACYAEEVIAGIRRQGARFSVTVPMNSKVQAAVAAIGEEAWTAVKYPRALWDDQLGCRASDAEVAETPYTAFEYDEDKAVTARLIVRRARDQNEKAAPGQGELFPAWRYHAVFTGEPRVFSLVNQRETRTKMRRVIITGWVYSWRDLQGSGNRSARTVSSRSGWAGLGRGSGRGSPRRR